MSLSSVHDVTRHSKLLDKAHATHFSMFYMSNSSRNDGLI